MKELNKIITIGFAILGLLLVNISENFVFNFSYVCLLFILKLILNIVAGVSYPKLIHVLMMGVILIVSFEGIFFSHETVDFVGEASALRVSTYINSALLSFILAFELFNNDRKTNFTYTSTVYKKNVFSMILIILLLAFFIYGIYDFAINAFQRGRMNVGWKYYQKTVLSTILLAINKSTANILPAIIIYHFRYVLEDRHYLIKSLVLSVPIWVFLFMVGTRYPILFSLGGYVIVATNQVKFNFSKIVKFLPLLLTLFLLNGVMLTTRGGGVNEANFERIFQKEKIIESVALNERVVKNSGMLIEYFDRYSSTHLYGQSSLFALYFWIPRAIWPSKPQVLGYWLMRSYYGGNVGFSAAVTVDFGFYGDAYADFGYWGGIFFCGVLGLIFCRVDNWHSKVIQTNSLSVLYATPFYAFAFFGVRSLNTAFFSLTGSMVIVLFYQLTLKKKRKQDSITQADMLP